MKYKDFIQKNRNRSGGIEVIIESIGRYYLYSR